MGSNCIVFMRPLLVLSVAAALCPVNVGWAQPAQGAPQVPGTSAATSADDVAWQIYDRAFVKLASGDTENARVLLQQLVADFDDHPAANQAAARLRELDISTGRPAPLANGERPRKFARGELALLMTAHGVYLGSNACAMANCTSLRARVASMMLGGGLGLGGSLLATRRGITQGQAQLITSASAWGLANAWLILGDGSDTDRNGSITQFVTHGLGVAAGVGLWRVWKPTSGEVSMANSGFLWTPVLYALGSSIIDRDISLRGLVVAADLGIVAGVALGALMPGMTRGRTLVIDAGGILGFLAGGLIVVTADANSAAGTSTPLLLGTVGGLLAAGYATRDWNLPNVGGNTRMTVMPVGREGWGLGLTGIWH